MTEMSWHCEIRGERSEILNGVNVTVAGSFIRSEGARNVFIDRDESGRIQVSPKTKDHRAGIVTDLQAVMDGPL